MNVWHRARLELFRLELARTQAAREFRLLFMDLALQFLYDKVDGGVHIHRRFLATQQDATGDWDSDLDDVAALRNRQQHLDIADGIKVFRDFANAFLHVLTQGRSDLDILASYSECCHKTHPLSYFYAAKRHNLLKKAKRRTLLDVTVSYPIREIRTLSVYIDSIRQSRTNPFFQIRKIQLFSCKSATRAKRKAKSRLRDPALFIRSYAVLMTLAACGPRAPSTISNSTS